MILQKRTRRESVQPRRTHVWKRQANGRSRNRSKANFRPWKMGSPERFRDTVRKIIAWDLDRIENHCDYVLAFWDEAAARGGGTAAEITFAYQLNKPVYLVLGMPRAAASGWILAAATEVFENFDALRAFLRNEHKSRETENGKRKT